MDIQLLTDARACLAAAVSALVLALAVSACGASASATVSIDRPCNQVAAVLSDGPDPGADPVGYAAAQVLPLRQLKLPNGSVQKAAWALASAYRLFATTNGSAHAKRLVAVASHALDVLCPGAAQ
jgi:hypothetical protein